MRFKTVDIYACHRITTVERALADSAIAVPIYIIPENRILSKVEFTVMFDDDNIDITTYLGHTKDVDNENTDGMLIRPAINLTLTATGAWLRGQVFSDVEIIPVNKGNKNKSYPMVEHIKDRDKVYIYFTELDQVSVDYYPIDVIIRLRGVLIPK